MRSHPFEKEDCLSSLLFEPRWMNPAGWPLFLPSCHSYVRTVASELVEDDSIGSSRLRNRVCMLGSEKSRMEPPVSVATLGASRHSCCAHRAISKHREMRGGTSISLSRRTWGLPRKLIEVLQ
jgi:ribosomal protein L32